MQVAIDLLAQLAAGAVTVAAAARTHLVTVVLVIALAALARQDISAHRRENTKFRGDRV